MLRLPVAMAAVGSGIGRPQDQTHATDTSSLIHEDECRERWECQADRAGQAVTRDGFGLNAPLIADIAARIIARVGVQRLLPVVRTG